MIVELSAIRRSLVAGLLLAAWMQAGTARGAEYFVATNGADSNDGLSWATPLLTISNGVAKATAAGPGSIVTVSNGTYNITTQLEVTAAITLCSFGNGVTGGLENAANTTIVATDGDNRRVLYVNHAGAVIDGLTMSGGRWIDGAGAYLETGTVQNCRITGNNLGSAGKGSLYIAAGGLASNCHVVANTATYQFAGIGVFMNGGTLRRSNISNNSADSELYAQGGVGIRSENAASLVDSCVITNNMVLSFDETGYGGGGGVSLGNGGTVRNSLIAGNVCKSPGGGVWGYSEVILASIIENCTIVGNASSNDAGGVYNVTVSNSIVYFNTSTNVAQNWSGCSMAYSCTTPTNGLTGAGNISGDPLFVNAGAGNYTLQAASPCIDTGTNQAWITGTTDLDGVVRILGGVVDMGAYEKATPSIRNLPVSSVAATSATMNGWLVSTGLSPTAVCVMWGVSNGGAAWGAWANTNWFEGTAWTNNSYPSTNITGLTADSTYYYTLGASNSSGMMVANPPTNFITGEVSVQATDPLAQWNGNAGQFTVYRAATCTNEALTVYYTIGGSASNGVDYDTISSSVQLAAGVTSAVVTVSPKYDQDMTNEEVVLTLAGGAYVIGTPGSAIVTNLPVEMMPGVKASGGTVTNYTDLDGIRWTAHLFTNSGTLIVTSECRVAYLVIGGGGGGGGGGSGNNRSGGAGGGAGGYRCSVSNELSGGGASAETELTLAVGSYAIGIGAGGAGGAVQVNDEVPVPGSNGGDSFIQDPLSADLVRAAGGGGGGGGCAADSGFTPNGPGSAGGSGGGAFNTNGASGTANQGFAGGGSDPGRCSGGGGGAGSVGLANGLPETDLYGNVYTNLHGGSGGTGVFSRISGSLVQRAGGGGGGVDTANSYEDGYGGDGGGGNGGPTNGSAGIVSTGSGGGGGNATYPGGAGGSGIVIVRYMSSGGGGAATVTLSNVTQAYDGNAKTVTVTTVPAGLAVVVTYNGGSAHPTNAGTYAVVATISDAGYVGQTNGTLTISKATPTAAVLPAASTIELGQRLYFSTLSGGAMTNSAGNLPVPGAFAWQNAMLLLTNSGTADVTFTPTETANYHSATVTVAVAVRGFAEWLVGYDLVGDPTNRGSNGYTYYESFIAGLNPTNADSVFRLQKPVLSGNQMTINFDPNLEWRDYRVLGSTNLVAGFDMTLVNWTSGGTGFVCNVNASNLFYKADARLPLP